MNVGCAFTADGNKHGGGGFRKELGTSLVAWKSGLD
jgi:hypothetical protein